MTKTYKAGYVSKDERWSEKAGKYVVIGCLFSITSVLAESAGDAAVRIHEELDKPGRGGYYKSWKESGCIVLDEETFKAAIRIQ